MQKTQKFIAENIKWQSLGRYILRIQTFNDTSPGIVIENCKSLVESICKTILVEATSETEETLKECSASNLYGKVKTLFFTDDQVYKNIIGSYVNAISEYRNKLDETSHGKDIYTLEGNQDTLIDNEIQFLIGATDDVASFLMSYYTDQYPQYAAKKSILIYDDNSEFNEWFDETEDLILVGGVSLSPSHVLFDGDREAYKTSLSEYLGKNELIEKLKMSSSFATTHVLMRELGETDSYSKPQISKLFEAFFFNNQVNWIATDRVVENFFKPLFMENKDLLSEIEIAEVNKYYNKET